MQDQEEGYSVDSRFSSHYLSMGGEEIFGDPISQAFVEDETPVLVLDESLPDDTDIFVEPGTKGRWNIGLAAAGLYRHSRQGARTPELWLRGQ